MKNYIIEHPQPRNHAREHRETQQHKHKRSEEYT